MASGLHEKSLFASITTRYGKRSRSITFKTVQFLVVTFLLSFWSPALAQSNYASLSGTVYDPGQKVVAGAVVNLTSTTTEAARQGTSNEQGMFQFTGLLPGDYKLNVQSPNFAALNQSVHLEVGQQMTLNVRLDRKSVV